MITKITKRIKGIPVEKNRKIVITCEMPDLKELYDGVYAYPEYMGDLDIYLWNDDAGMEKDKIIIFAYQNGMIYIFDEDSCGKFWDIRKYSKEEPEE